VAKGWAVTVGDSIFDASCVDWVGMSLMVLLLACGVDHFVHIHQSVKFSKSTAICQVKVRIRYDVLNSSGRCTGNLYTNSPRSLYIRLFIPSSGKRPKSIWSNGMTLVLNFRGLSQERVLNRALDC